MNENLHILGQAESRPDPEANPKGLPRLSLKMTCFIVIVTIIVEKH